MRALIFGLALTVSIAPTGHAQRLQGAALSLTGGVLMKGSGLSSPEAAIWLDWTHVGRRLTPDARVFVLPGQFGGQSDAIFGGDIGVAKAFGSASATALLGLGASALVGVGGGDTFFDPGAYAGAGVIVRLGGRLGLRLDAREHLYVESGDALLRLTAGAGLSLLPR